MSYYFRMVTWVWKANNFQMVKLSSSGCYLAFDWFFVNFSLMLLIKLLVIKVVIKVSIIQVLFSWFFLAKKTIECKPVSVKYLSYVLACSPWKHSKPLKALKTLALLFIRPLITFQAACSIISVLEMDSDKVGHCEWMCICTGSYIGWSA